MIRDTLWIMENQKQTLPIVQKSSKWFKWYSLTHIWGQKQHNKTQLFHFPTVVGSYRWISVALLPWSHRSRRNQWSHRTSDSSEATAKMLHKRGLEQHQLSKLRQTLRNLLAYFFSMCICQGQNSEARKHFVRCWCAICQRHAKTHGWRHGCSSFSFTLVWKTDFGSIPKPSHHRFHGSYDITRMKTCQNDEKFNSRKNHSFYCAIHRLFPEDSPNAALETNFRQQQKCWKSRITSYYMPCSKLT